MQDVDETLYDSNRMLNTLISNLPGMVCRFKNDLDWTMEYMSEGCVDLTGYFPEELIGNRTISYGNITNREDNVQVWNAIQNAILHGSRYQVEYRINTKSGEEKWVWEQGVGVYNDNGYVISIEAFMTDISKQKRTECSFYHNIQELKDRNMELDTFTYRVSHDIRSPLLTIYGLTSLLRMEKDYSEIALFCQKIDDTVKKLDVFTKDLLIYSRSKETKENPELIDFHRLVQESLLDSGFPNYQELVHVEVEVALAREVKSEIFRLKVILSNLIANAIKYRDVGKAVSTLKIKIMGNDTHFMIIVEDNGIGVSPEHQHEVFKMFFRASDISEGTGLGLYIVKMNTEKLGGTITCAGMEGIGTTFSLAFPLC